MLVLVPELRWANAPPLLDGWARANLSLRTARARGDDADGYLSVGKGGRAAVPSRAFGVGRVAPTPQGGLRLLDWARLREHDAEGHEQGELGTLGRALSASGRPWVLVSTDLRAAAAAADPQGVVPRAVAGGAAEVRQALVSGAGAVVAAVPAGEVPAVADGAGDACVIVASVSSPGNDRHLGALALSPRCRLGRGGLSSPSTHQRGLATLADVAPTFLDRLGTRPGPPLVGSAVKASGMVRRAELVDRDRRAVTSDTARTPLVWLFVVLSGVGAGVALRLPSSRPIVAYALLAVPPAGFLVMAVPWWRWGGWAVLLPGTLAVGALAGAAAVVGRRDARLGLGAMAAATAAVVGIDAAFGGGLEIDAPFGSSAIGGGRFYGVGNIGAGFLIAALVVATGIALDLWGRRALVPAAGALGAGVVVGGAPWFGADVGGVLTAVPAYGTLLTGWRRGRPPLRLLGALVAGAVVLLAVFLAFDLARTPENRTHLGRVVSEGDLGQEVVSKAGRALATVTAPMTLLAVVGVAAVAMARPRLRDHPALEAVAWALAVAAVIGSVVNDSGLVVAAAVAAVGWPALLGATAPPAALAPAAEGGR